MAICVCCINEKLIFRFSTPFDRLVDMNLNFGSISTPHWIGNNCTGAGHSKQIFSEVMIFFNYACACVCFLLSRCACNPNVCEKLSSNDHALGQANVRIYSRSHLLWAGSNEQRSTETLDCTRRLSLPPGMLYVCAGNKFAYIMKWLNKIYLPPGCRSKRWSIIYDSALTHSLVGVGVGTMDALGGREERGI